MRVNTRWHVVLDIYTAPEKAPADSFCSQQEALTWLQEHRNDDRAADKHTEDIYKHGNRDVICTGPARDRLCFDFWEAGGKDS